MRYRKVAEETYEASDRRGTVTVERTWRRAGGWGWHVRGLGFAQPVSRTRQAAAEYGLRRLSR